MSKLLYLIPFQIRDYQFPHKLIISSKIEPDRSDKIALRPFPRLPSQDFRRNHQKS